MPVMMSPDTKYDIDWMRKQDRWNGNHVFENFYDHPSGALDHQDEYQIRFLVNERGAWNGAGWYWTRENNWLRATGPYPTSDAARKSILTPHKRGESQDRRREEKLRIPHDKRLM